MHPQTAWAKGKPVTIGELDGGKSERILGLESLFKGAGFSVDISRNVVLAGIADYGYLLRELRNRPQAERVKKRLVRDGALMRIESRSF